MIRNTLDKIVAVNAVSVGICPDNNNKQHTVDK